MTMTPERLAELDAVMAKVRAFSFGSEEWEVAFIPARLAAYNAYPDLRAHIEAQAATIARQAEALRQVQALITEVMDLERIGAAQAIEEMAPVVNAALAKIGATQ